MKQTIIKSILIFMCLSLFQFASAQDSTAKFSSCLIDSLNGKERKELAKWIFMAIAVHPSIESYAKIDKVERENTDKYVGALVTKLLTKLCPSDFKQAIKDNPLALQQGFELVGKVAMQEIMTNEATMKALAEYVKYADLESISAVTAEK